MSSEPLGRDFSRRDFTLPPLFACLVLRQFYNLSHRRAEALLEDAPSWRRAIGLKKTPDHNTLCDAFTTLAAGPAVAGMLDEVARAFGEAGPLDLENKPLAIGSTAFESRHVSRHYEKRKGKARKAETSSESEEPGDSGRSATARAVPKPAAAVACSRHPILSARTTTGLGADHPHFEPVLFDAWRRADVRTVVADAGYDGEAAHELARSDMTVESIIPPRAGRPTDERPPTRYRGLMFDAFSGGPPEVYGQRWQAETANSMMKRNYGSSLRARTPQRREREMLLKVPTHNVAL